MRKRMVSISLLQVPGASWCQSSPGVDLLLVSISGADLWCQSPGANLLLDHCSPSADLSHTGLRLLHPHLTSPPRQSLADLSIQASNYPRFQVRVSAPPGVNKFDGNPGFSS